MLKSKLLKKKALQHNFTFFFYKVKYLLQKLSDNLEMWLEALLSFQA